MSVATIDVESLRRWLEEGRAVTVVDVRASADREQWAIPGSLHVDAYEDLKAGRVGALTRLDLPHAGTVVTVCGAGNMSERAAEQLEARGIAAYSLAGGMKAWSLAWNIAEWVENAVRVVQVRRAGKGCLSYVVCSGEDAMVIDASLPPEIYRRIAAERGTSIRFCADTHIHADHLSRSRALAEVTGATLLLPAQKRVRFPHRPWLDGEEIALGSARLRAVATPGHTPESLCIVLEGRALFSGDTLFPHSVGRPDLHTADGSAAGQAAKLHGSIARLLRLPGHLRLCAGHARAPPAFDGVFLSEPLREVGERLHNWLASPEVFVQQVLARIPPTPENYQQMVDWNEAGTMPPGDPTELEAGANRCAIA